MKKLLLASCVFVLGAMTYGQAPEFRERIVNSRDGRSDYFLPIRVRFGRFTGDVIVESYSLFDYLRASRGFDSPAYKTFALSLLNERKVLEMNGVKVDDRGLFLSGKNLKEHTFRIVKPSPAVEDVAKKGCEEFIRYYFGPALTEVAYQSNLSCKERIRLNAKDLLLKPRYDLTEENNVILRLFEMGIPTYVDDISGSLKIAYSTLD